ncbi:MAG: adenylate/guanylate cyclase domain-containing protein [Bacteroidota bacterium]|jgi:adenylate cyclase
MNKPVLLCVDDEAIILLSLKDQLREHFSEEYQLEMVESGDDALRLFQELASSGIDVPLIICDQIMPGMKGNQLLRQIHQLNPKTFSVLLTGQADASAVGDAVNHANLYRYIAKPWEETDLVMTIKEAVRSFYQDRQLEEQNITLQAMNENLEQRVEDRTAEVVQQKEEIQRQMQSIEHQRQELEVRNEFIKGVFGRYVSDEVMDTVLRSPEALQIGGAKRDITVLMSDLRGFTTLTDRLAPEIIMKLLNRYFESMIEIISEHGGIVIEFLGDGIMAIFGAPKQLESHADQAITCALSMQLAMESLNEAHVGEGLPEIEMGIGLASGDVVVGNIGSKRRAKYGVVGTPANLAARIEALSTGQQVLISADTLSRCRSRVIVEHEFQVSVKGIKDALTIYDISGIENGTLVHFHPRDLTMLPVRREVIVELAVLDGKSVSLEHVEARIESCSRRMIRLLLEHPLPRHTDVRICAVTIAGERTETETYAKVTSSEDGTMSLHFTSIFFDEADPLFKEIIALPGTTTAEV